MRDRNGVSFIVKATNWLPMGVPAKWTALPSIGISEAIDGCAIYPRYGTLTIVKHGYQAVLVNGELVIGQTTFMTFGDGEEFCAFNEHEVIVGSFASLTLTAINEAEAYARNILNDDVCDAIVKVLDQFRNALCEEA